MTDAEMQRHWEQAYQLERARNHQLQAELREARAQVERWKRRASEAERRCEELGAEYFRRRQEMRDEGARLRGALRAAGVSMERVPGGAIVTAPTFDTTPPGVERGSD